MHLTLEELKKHVSHVVPGGVKDDFPTSDNARRVVNEAGRYLMSVRHWNFRNRGPLFLNFTSGSRFIPLPSDVGDLTAVVAKGLVRSFELTTYDKLLRLESQDVFPPNLHYFGALTYRDSEAAELPPCVQYQDDAGSPQSGLAAFEIVSNDDNLEIMIDSGPDNTMLARSAGASAEDLALGDGVTLADVATWLEGRGFIVSASVTDSYSPTAAASTLPTTSGFWVLIGNDQETGYLHGNLACVDPTSESFPAIWVYPTPVVSENEALIVTYRMKWRDLVESGEKPNIPEWAEALLIQYVRAFASGYQEDHFRTPTSLLNEIEEGGIFRHTIRMDSELQPTYGRIENGQVQSIGRGRLDYLDNPGIDLTNTN